jgi:hypothetical protein
MFLWLFIHSISLHAVNYQLEMMKNLRFVNVDHLHVGWYRTTSFGTYVNKEVLDSQFTYQFSIDESIVLIYGKIELFLFIKGVVNHFDC